MHYEIILDYRTHLFFHFFHTPNYIFIAFCSIGLMQHLLGSQKLQFTFINEMFLQEPSLSTV